MLWHYPADARAWIGSDQGGSVLSYAVAARTHYPESALQFRSHGAACLADWLMRDEKRAALLSMLSANMIDRIIVGEVDPAPEMAALIERVSEGTLTAQMFDTFTEVGCGPAIEDLRTNKGDAVLPAWPVSALGEIGKGPLVRISHSGEGYFVKLPGVVLALDRGTAAGLREALGRAIDDDPRSF